MKLHHWMILPVLTAAVMLGGCGTNPVTGKKQFLLISRDQEIAMGEEAAPEFEKEFDGEVPNQELQQYVGSVGAKLAAVSERPMPYEYTLVASDVPNAFALPGGKIFITAGLMSRMSNERELAAVLGHETAHVAAMHNVQGMLRQMGSAVLVQVAGIIVGADKQKAAEAAAKVVGAMANLKYSRNDEYEGDKYGILYMTRAGYNPYGMVELLTTLKNLSDTEGGTLTEMFQTHPLTSKRIEEAQQTIETGSETKKFSPKAPDPYAARFLRMRRVLEGEMAKGAK